MLSKEICQVSSHTVHKFVQASGNLEIALMDIASIIEEYNAQKEIVIKEIDTLRQEVSTSSNQKDHADFKLKEIELVARLQAVSERSLSDIYQLIHRANNANKSLI